MLAAMRRNVSAEVQERLVHRLRDRIPGLALRTTFITGFPGETEEDHQQLIDFIDRVQFAINVAQRQRATSTRNHAHLALRDLGHGTDSFSTHSRYVTFRYSSAVAILSTTVS